MLCDWGSVGAGEVTALLSFLQTIFFRQHGCNTNDTNAKYNSRAANLYREKIKTLATQATRKHGTEASMQRETPAILVSATRGSKTSYQFPLLIFVSY